MTLHPSAATIDAYSLPPSLCWVFAIWMAASGACIGSFLNVVIYRLPRGMSLIHPASACPACGRTIRWRDNIPVLSWYWLSGRCRDCGTTISARYPANEALVAAVFFLLAWAGPLGGAWNLPATERELAGLCGPLTWCSGPHLFLLWGYHALLISTLIAMSAIAADRVCARYPWRLWWSMFAVGMAAGVVWPTLRPVAAVAGIPEALVSQGALIGAFDGLFGTLAGAAVATAAWPIVAGDQRRPAAAASALVGSFLGGQAALLIGAAATLGCALSLVSRCCRPAWMRWLVGASFGWLIGWRWLHAKLDWAGSVSGGATIRLLIAVLCGTAIVAFASHHWTKHRNN